MGSGRNNHVCGNMGSDKLFRQGCTRVHYPIWLRGIVCITINVLRRMSAKLAVHSAINIISWPFSVLSLITLVGVGYFIIIICCQRTGLFVKWSPHLP